MARRLTERPPPGKCWAPGPFGERCTEAADHPPGLHYDALADATWVDTTDNGGEP